MKRVLVSMILALTAMVGFAQNVGDAIYFYRNDGDFNAFIRTDIDSITYSNYDIDSVYYDDIMTQVIYTADSIYRIPLVAIDSVSFVNVETILNKDAYPLTKEHTPYILYGNEDSFCMDVSTPESLRPQIGNIVVCAYDCTAFPYGIVGRVERITENGKGYIYECSRATYDEVFDQIVVCSKLTNDPEDYHGPNTTRAKDPDAKDFELWNFEDEYSLEIDDGAKLALKLGNSANATVTVRKFFTQSFFWQMKVSTDFKGSLSFNAETESGFEKEKQLGNTKTLKRLPVPYTLGLIWLYPKLSLFGYMEGNSKMNIDFLAKIEHSESVTMTYQKGEWEPLKHESKDTAGIDLAQVNLSGTLEAGLIPQIDFSLNGRQAGIGIKGKVGLKAFINFEFDAKAAVVDGLYDALKDSYCSVSLPWSVTVSANANVFKKYDAEHNSKEFRDTIQPGENKIIYLLKDSYIFPEISDVYARGVSGDNKSAVCMASVQRKTLLPVSLGFQLYDVNNQPVGPFYYDHYYSGNPLTISVDANGLGGGKYTVRPIVHMMDRDFLASPTTELIKVATFPCEISGDSFTMKGKVYGTTSNKMGFYYNTTSDLSADVAQYVSAEATNNGEFEATISTPESNAVYFVAAADIPDPLGHLEESRGEEQIATNNIHYTGNPDEPTPGKMVDLGLSVKWAGWDIGSDSPEVKGDYYAWGETFTKSEYTSENYTLIDDERLGWEEQIVFGGGTRRNPRCFIGNQTDDGRDISGTEYDAAHVIWGEDWRMPSKAEAEELCANCTQKRIKYKGVDGVLFTGPNGNRIFLPWESRWDYWTSTYGVHNIGVHQAYSLSCQRSKYSVNWIHVDSGIRIRAVSGKKKEKEICAFFEAPATWDNTIHCWAWSDSPEENFTGGTWPGVPCELVGTAENGNNIWKWTWDGNKQNGTTATQPEMIIFNNNGQPQTVDMEFKPNGYYNNYGIIDKTPSEPLYPDCCTYDEGDICAFFEAPDTWDDTIHCWAWTDTDNFTGGSWPGVSCELVGTANNGNKIWKWTWNGWKQYDTDATQPEMIIFNNNPQPQTQDMPFTLYGYYTIDGYQGVIPKK